MAYKKIDPMFKKKWLKALRSDIYQQAEGALVRHAGPYGVDHPPVGDISTETHAFCCLGVAAEVLGKGKKSIWEKQFDSRIPSKAEGTVAKWRYEDDPGTSFLKDMGLLPKELSDKVGLTAASQLRLSDLNDEGNDFEFIADWIESDL